MNSYMVSLKYDFEEFRSKHWLYMSTFADISVGIPVISYIDTKRQCLLIKLICSSKVDSMREQRL